MKLLLAKSNPPRIWGKKKPGRKAGSVNKKHKYLAVITLPGGKKEYIYPEDVGEGKTLHQVVQERTAKHDKVENVEYSPKTDPADRTPAEAFAAVKRYIAEKLAPHFTADKEPVPKDNRERAKKLKLQLKIDLQQKQSTPTDTPQGENWANIHNVKEKQHTDVSDAPAPVVVDPLTYTAENVLAQINESKKTPQSEPLHLNIPRIDVSQLPPDYRERILERYSTEEGLQQALQDRPVTTLLSLGLMRTNPKTGLPLLNKKEMSQLTAEWYGTIRNTIRAEMPAFRLTEEYNKRRSFDESKGRKVEGRWVPKDRYNRAVASGVMLGKDDTEKTRTKEMIDSLSADYMAVAFDRLREKALNYKAYDKTKSGKPSRFDRAAFRDIQLSVRSKVNSDLRSKYGMTEIPRDVQPNIIDIDDRENPPPLKSGIRQPDEQIEYEQIADKGRQAFFSHFNKLPEAYRKILSLHLQINFGEHDFETNEVEGAKQHKGGMRGSRSFADIAQHHPTWKVPTTSRDPDTGEAVVGEKEVNLGDMSKEAQTMFLIRLESAAREALKREFAPKRLQTDERSETDTADVPLSKEGKLAFQWLKLQAKLAERGVPTPSEHAPGTVVPGKQGKKQKELKVTRVPLTNHPNAPGVRFFVQKEAEASKMRTRDLETAIAMGTAPGPLPAKPAKLLSPEQRDRLARMESLYTKLHVGPQVRTLEGHSTQLNVVPPEKQRMAMRYLHRLYQTYTKTSKLTTDKVEQRTKALKKLHNQLKKPAEGVEAHEAENRRRRVEEMLTIHKYILAERAAVTKSLTLRDFDNVLDEFDFQLGRLHALS